MARRLLLTTLLVLGIAADIAFVLINLHPERPHFAEPQHVRILIRSTPARAQWLKTYALSEFAADHDLQVDVQVVATWHEMLAALRAEKANPGNLALVGLDDDYADDVQAEGLVRAVADVAQPDELKAMAEEYLPHALHQSQIKGRQWFVPKRSEIDVTVYLAPAVEDAFLNWERDRAAIQSALAEANGVGLPEGYTLEKAPDAWDTYDLFVAAWYWAHHPAPWSSSPAPAPRIAFRCGGGEDAVVDLLATFRSFGMKTEELGQTSSPGILRALQWHALFRRHHLLTAACETPAGLDEDALNLMMRNRLLAWAPMDQEDSVWLHGGARRDAEPGMQQARDLAWAPQPFAASLEQKAGQPAFTGSGFSFVDMQLWMIPVRAAQPRVSLALARWLSSRDVQRREAEAQGMLPIRKDLNDQASTVFRLDWLQDILLASFQQLDQASGDLPGTVITQHFDKLYSDLYAKVILERPLDAPVTPEALREAIGKVPHGR